MMTKTTTKTTTSFYRKYTGEIVARNVADTDGQMLQKYYVAAVNHTSYTNKTAKTSKQRPLMSVRFTVNKQSYIAIKHFA